MISYVKYRFSIQSDLSFALTSMTTRVSGKRESHNHAQRRSVIFDSDSFLGLSRVAFLGFAAVS